MVHWAYQNVPGRDYGRMSLMKHGMRADGSKATRALGLSYTPIRDVVEEAVTRLKRGENRNA